MKHSRRSPISVKQIYRCRFEPQSSSSWDASIASNNDDKLRVAVHIRDDDLIARGLSGVSGVVSDLIELAIAVNVVDRAIHPETNSACRVHIELPLRNPELLGASNNRQMLSDILYWYTGYDWTFEFIHRTAPLRKSEQPQLFNWLDDATPKEIALWSGGLDCYAGLLIRARDSVDQQFVLCGTGRNTFVHGLQHRIYDALPRDLKARTKLARVQFSAVAMQGELPRAARLRSRGFTFMLIGAMCAVLEGSSVLQVYENGIGAINLRFRDSEIGLNHARSVHPLSLMKIAEWLTSVFGRQFRIENPFLFWTKAQMCSVLEDDDARSVAFQTHTCDRPHRKAEARQCGQCSSCILRRLSFAANHIFDATPYVHMDEAWLHGDMKFDHVAIGNHIPSAIYQLNTLTRLTASPDPWQSLAGHFESLNAEIVDRTSHYLLMSPNSIRDGLLNLYRQYVYEWEALRSN